MRDCFRRLAGVAEVDEAYVGGTPKFKKGVKNKCGRGVGKHWVMVAADRTEQAKAALIPNAKIATLGPIMKEWTDPSSALMTDSNTLIGRLAGASHHTTLSTMANDSIRCLPKARINTAWVDNIFKNIWTKFCGAGTIASRQSRLGTKQLHLTSR
ncbi:transposase [Shimia thalassica]|uniref:transposase n=1 Tax=Shimia thalassica TaxID=1715693 RepID=UPI0026E3EF3B|nr:transposase [Shimia thalassica]MDO6481985.1 transposase [Shimia thalassica]